MRWLLLCLAACGAPPLAETPVYITPDDHATLEAVAADELARWRREVDERFTEALDPGEAAEHARRVTQGDIEAGSVGLADIFLQGETLFERRFTREEGLGTGRLDRPAPGHSRVQNPAILGGPDALACKDCHFRGGDDGHGELHQRAWLDGDGRHLSSAVPRVPPMLAGLGLVQALAREMTAEIAKQVEDFRAARRAGLPGEGRLRLVSKGVEFGTVRVAPDGTVDTTGLTAIDPDRVVRPFGWQGRHADLRSFVREALPQHLGLEPVPRPTEAAAEPARPRHGPLDSAVIDRRAGLFDADADGVGGEVRDGQLTALVVYLALLDAPRVVPPRTPAAQAAWARGHALFDSLGCAECHRRELPLESTTQTEGPADRPPFRYDLTQVQVPPTAEHFPPIWPGRPRRALPVPLYSDLRRHDLGPAMSERGRTFLTRPLWGLGDRGPYYLHDGRARSLAAAIEAHGGAAEASRAAWRALAPADQRALDVFLLSLRRQPQGRYNL